MKSRPFQFAVAAGTLLLSVALCGVRTYELMVEIDPLTGFAKSGMGGLQTVLLTLLLAGAVVIAVLCFISGRVADVKRSIELPTLVRWVGLALCLALIVDAVIGVPAALSTLGTAIGVLSCAAKLAVVYTILAESIAFTDDKKFAYRTGSLFIEAIPVIYCAVILLNTFLNFIAFNSTSQHLIEQMGVIAAMLFFLGTFSFCLQVNKASDYMLTVIAGFLGFLFLSVSIVPPLLLCLLSGSMPAFLTKAVGFSPVMSISLMLYMGLFSLFLLTSKQPTKVRVLPDQL